MIPLAAVFVYENSLQKAENSGRSW